MFEQKHAPRRTFYRVAFVLIIVSVLAVCALSFGCQAETTATTLAPTPTPSPTPTVTPSPTPTPNPPNPLTGEPLINATAVGQRPVAIMINNHKDGVPQIGIQSADLFYEMPVEGGITRMMAVFTDVSTVPEIGTLRSARHDFIDVAGGLDAILVHIGASYAANDQFSRQKYNHIDLHVFPDSYWRDEAWRHDRGYEHSVKTTGEMLLAAITKKEFRMTVREGQKTAFNFRATDDFAATGSDVAVNVTIPFSNYCTAYFYYTPATRLYSKGEYGTDQIDLATGEAIQFTNVFLLVTKVSHYKSDAVLKEIDLSKGQGYYITGGKSQVINWAKGETNNSFVFTDVNGAELQVNAGKSYIGVVPTSVDIAITG